MQLRRHPAPPRQRSASQVAVGFSVHTGWAVAVAVAPHPVRVLKRERFALADDADRFAYHRAAEQPTQAEPQIARVAADARARAAAFLRQLEAELGPFAVVTPPPKRALPELAAILRSHQLIHAAEGELYRRAVAEAAADLGLAVELVGEAKPLAEKLPPPWSRDHREAAARALAALR